MFENDDDVILPDDFEETTEDTPTSDESDSLTGEETEVEPSAQENTPSEQQEEPFLLAKYNKEDKPLTREEAQRLAQIGMHYENKVKSDYESLQNDPRLSFVEQLAKQNGFDSFDEFQQAFQQQQEQSRLDELVQQNIPEEYAKKMIEFEKLQEKIYQQDQQREQEAREKEEYGQFFQAFEQMNGRPFNPDTDQISDEVFEIARQGIPLKYAYLEFQNKQLVQQQQIYKQNQTNKGKAVAGSTTNHGGSENQSKDPFLEGFDSYDY